MAFDPISAGLNLGKSLVDTLAKWIPDTAQRDQAAAEIAGQVNELIAGQIRLNEVDAKATSKFITHWRPATGWICVLSLGYATMGYVFLNWIIGMVSLTLGVATPTLPPPDTTITFELLFGMLGLGGMRTFEKLKGLTK